jgi:RNA polymerase sigma factor for flagellar operon FliA
MEPSGRADAITPVYEPLRRQPGGHRKKESMAATATKAAPAKDLSRRDDLILNHLSLVTAIATRLQETLPVHVDLDDLIHAGVMGLFDAADKYDSAKQVAFPAYAKHRIKGAILDSLRDLDWASRDMRRRQKQMDQVTRELTAELHREPDQAEIAERMGISGNRWRQMMIDFRNIGMIASQNSKHDREDQAAPEPPCASDHHPDRMFARTELRACLGAAMETLPRRYQQVVTMYYDGDMTMKEIGSRLGVNESRVSQIHKSALARMQLALESNGIQSAAVF